MTVSIQSFVADKARSARRRAIAVGAVAGLAVLGVAPAATAGPTDPITMPDAELQACVNDTIDPLRAPTDAITEAEAAGVVNLECAYADFGDITDLTGLENFDALETAWFSGNNEAIADLSPLSGLDSLDSLSLYQHGITSTAPLAGLDELRYLNLNRNPDVDLAGITGLTGLTSLALSNLSSLDVSELDQLTSLNALSLSNNNLGDAGVADLPAFPNLTQLNLSWNGITDIGPISGYPNLANINIQHNDVDDLSPIAALGSLLTLRTTDNNIFDLSDVPSSVTTLSATTQSVDLGQVAVGTANPNPVVDVNGAPVALDSLYDSGTNTFTATTAGNQSITWSGTDFNGTLTAVAIPAADAVVIPDDNLRACVNDSLGQGPNEAISSSQAGTITTLDCSSVGGNGITDLTGLDALTSLTGLDLSDDVLEDITVLGQMPSLIELDLGGNNISDVSPLTNLVNLKELDLHANANVDLGQVAQITGLEYLVLKWLGITDVTALTPLTALVGLDLAGNDITDPSPLAALTNLEYLDLSDNSITDISSLPPYDYDTYYLNVRNQNVDLGNLESGVGQGNPVVGSGGQPVALSDLYDAAANTFTPTDSGPGEVYWGGSDDYFTGTLSFTVTEATDPNPGGGEDPAPGDGADDPAPGDQDDTDDPAPADDADQPATPVLAETGVDSAAMGLVAAVMMLAGGLVVARGRRTLKR